MIIQSGIIIFVGLVFIAVKLPTRTSLWLLGHAIWVDVLVSTVTYAMHYGTYSGVMAAAFAGVLTSVFTTVAIWFFGCIKKGKYIPGKVWPIDVAKLP